MTRIIWIDGSSLCGALARTGYVRRVLLGVSQIDGARGPLAELLRELIREWQADLWKHKRFCFGCGKQCWHSAADERPAAIVLLWAHGLEEPSEVVMAPVCRGCSRRRDANEHIDRVIAELFPGAQKIDHKPVAGPTTVQ